MAKQTIALGTAPTGTGGDTPRTAFTKAQGNFDELYAALGGSGSPSALPTALPVTKGGTGNTTGTATKLAAAVMVGTVSQSSGVPTGAIFERGSNAQGSYIRFADGTQIAWISFTTNSTSTYALGALWGSDGVVVGGFPATFIGIPSVTAGLTRGPLSNGSWPVVVAAGSASTWGTWRALSVDGSVAGTIIYLTAIGRWF